MSLEQVSYAAGTVASIAVVASLIYAALQFRAYAKAAREARFVSTSSVIEEFNKLLATDADVARIFRTGLADMRKLRPVERWRFDALMKMLVSNMQYLEEFRDVHGRAYFLRQVGIQIIRRPGAQQWWTRGRVMFPPSTVAIVEKMIKEQGLLTAPDATAGVAEGAGGAARAAPGR